MTTPTFPSSGNAPGHDPATEFSPRTGKILVIGVLVAVFGGIAAFVVVKLLNPPAPAYHAGDCVEVVNGGRYAAEVKKADCGQQTALYEVGLYLDDPDESCPGENYSTFKQTGGRQQEYKLCLMLNAKEGDCVKIPMISAGEEKKVACTASEANLTVTKVIEGTADKNACDPESIDNARVYPKPKRTLCLGPVTT